ncbi:DUF2254 domain-containing protein [Halobacillus yeomjeoni]|uniref:DUF2254 domain-containing protein n=1 Tax=Halobacillus yeomjeoni TaxID=311194 RepID=UPI001CD2FB70|nr:DUF2254 domain-containing protein [Halobacillus yeomjeoni]MCA0985082.1 DUF2254 domain-containing protein [Halobacillus yeomjeoni]
MNKEKRAVSIRNSFWYIPALYGISSLLLVLMTSTLDFWLVSQFQESLPKILLTKKSVAQTLYGALITSILTMTTISFSTIMVVLTTYTTQFSPRTLQDFMKNRLTQHVLGVYVLGFIFSLINLLILGSDRSGLLSPTLTVLLSIVCLAFFIIFIHHSSRFVQVNNLIGQIRKSGSSLIQSTFEEKDFYQSSTWDQNELDDLNEEEKRPVYAQRSGYLQAVRIESIIGWAKQNHMIIEANFQIGDYIQKGMPIFYCWYQNDGEQSSIEECLAFIVIGNERTDEQDIEFSIQKLVEIAVKAISPSINDPHTAVNCINRIGSLLTELASVYQPIRYYSDEEEQLRFMMNPRLFRDYLFKSFYLIRIYGKHDLAVMTGVLEALYKLAATQDSTVKQEVWKFGETILNSIDRTEMDDWDIDFLEKQAEKLEEVCREEKIQ